MEPTNRPWEHVADHAAVFATAARQALEALLEDWRLLLPDDGVAKILAHLQVLQYFNPRLNLTSLTDPAVLVAELVGDSLLLLELEPHLRATDVVDIGTGGGVPGIPLAIARPGWTLELLERKSSIALYLEEAVRQVPVLNATVLNIALEDYPSAKMAAPLLFTSKAVFHVEQCCQLLEQYAPKTAQAAWWGTPGLDHDRLPPGWRIEASVTKILPTIDRPTAVYLLSRE